MIKHRQAAAWMIAVGALTAGVFAVPVQGLAAQAIQTNVSVSIGKSLGRVPSTAIGVNDAVWDPDLLDAAVPSLLKNAGVKMMRFPGGSSSDVYDWKTNTMTDGGYANPNDTFDAFMNVVKKVGAQPIITVNYGTNPTHTAGGDPQLAADWVKYANVTKKYGVNYWEIGNEIYGNGSYGTSWEADLHPQKGPEAYAKNALKFIKAMKAVDPHIHIGVVLTCPTAWPDGQTPDWNSTELSIVGKSIDFVIVHWYAQNPAGNGQPGESDDGLLNSTSAIPSMMATLHQEIQTYCGANAKHVQVFLTETNSVSYNPGKQTVSLVNALFLAQDYMSWLENGAANVDWWDVHNGIQPANNNSPTLYGKFNYGDYGLLSVGGASNGKKEPPANTPFPPYYALQLVHELAAPGDTMVEARSSQSMIQAFAVRKRDGGAVLLVNDSPSVTYKAHVAVPNAGGSKRAEVYFYGEHSSRVSQSSVAVQQGAASIQVPPYSITVVKIGK
ncbi:MAG: hypothetical protein K6T83_22185 [Alicyclobacillus sp.]|nr:hypothetical protein [Alicyclobacillus sp.]